MSSSRLTINRSKQNDLRGLSRLPFPNGLLCRVQEDNYKCSSNARFDFNIAVLKRILFVPKLQMVFNIIAAKFAVK